MFKKILIANRGEIAVRVLAACQELGVAAVTVHSEADVNAPHVRLADASYCLGPAPVPQSYLNVARLLEVALEAGCDAIHPGYGLLSENADFARRCQAAGLVFIGPAPDVIAAMGNKTQAREVMRAAGVPVVPGSSGRASDLDHARALAAEVGYPVMLKASAGGGGIGMQALAAPEELDKAWKMATARAKAYFGDDAMYVEKLIARPRHVEIQLLADHHGHVVHLFERDCSIQRRHQKMIEESPAPGITPALRAEMGEIAVKAAAAIGYTNAGTMEFLVDADSRFYFLEMNTRIQVEHPVTELVTGTDLVVEQIRIAAGEPLRWSQADLAIRGHAIEARLYAEDPKTFMPAPGQITALNWPLGPHIRIDTWIDADTLITPHYDPMLAKVIAWGETRDEAVARLARALRDTHVAGIKTNASALLAVLDHAEFQSGHYDTSFISTHLTAAPVRAATSL